ncbi:DNA-directed RNA polymerase I subunit RPA43 [Trachymyrmex zeteki]|uniref:DNA-directed RNA polymerase I subunit RPA43 n=1 Tax=Mycetomoellerius zeteki TaxID=64791 RepID=A0A151XFY0_9HYME|nr:DNA-directed RNA polymerase I subunit RPA43 [Trachymyrmex zeteki]
MKCQKNRGVTWTTLELGGLLEDEDSHVHFVRTTKHLALHPYHLNNIQRGLNEILRSLKGFVLAFRNPKLLSNLGELLYDSPFIHVDIEADFYLFHPTVGSFLKGIVNKKGLDYIVILVHKIYTVSIPKPDNTEQWLGESVEIGQEIKCCITQIHHKSKPPFICATLKSDYSQGCRLSESITDIDNIDSTVESANSCMKIDINGILENDGISEKEKKKHRKKHKSRESNSEIVYKIENESDTLLNTDDSLNTLEVDNIPRKHKKNKKTSKSLLNNETILDERTESCKAVKRENSILLDSITEIETKKKKKRVKKSKESDSEFLLTKTENDKEIVNSTRNTIPYIKYEEEQHISKKHIVLNVNTFSNKLGDSVSKKHKKNKKPSMIMSDSESESHIIEIKNEKHDPCINRIINERAKSQTSCSKTQVIQNVNETFDTPEFMKRENSIKYDTSEKERKKSPKKHNSRDSRSKSFEIKIEHDIISNVSNASDKEKKKSFQKRANLSRDSDSEFKIKSENITNDINYICRTIKHDPEESQYMKYNTSAIDSSNSAGLHHVSKKSKKKKTSVVSDSELKLSIKIEKD